MLGVHTWSARSKSEMRRASVNCALHSSQSRARLVSSVFCIVRVDSAEPLPAVPVFAYCWKMEASWSKQPAKMANASFSQSGKPRTCLRSILSHVAISCGLAPLLA
jgi:hypothetical protein